MPWSEVIAGMVWSEGSGVFVDWMREVLGIQCSQFLSTASLPFLNSYGEVKCEM
jgi:hypothetical protein